MGMDSKTNGTATILNQEVIDLVVEEDKAGVNNEPTVVPTVGPLDQGPTAAPAPLSAQEPLPTTADSLAHPPSNADDSVKEEEREEERGEKGEGEAASAPPTESGSHPSADEEVPSSSSSSTAQIPPPGLPPPSPAPPARPGVLLPSQIVIPISEAVTRFKPSSRDVISGIAPHVFDERRRRRSPYASSGRQGSSGRRSSSPRCRYGYRQGRPRASPLRMSVVISLDDRSIYIEDASSVAAKLAAETKQQPRSDSKSASPTPISPSKKMLWTKFKLDGALFKTLVSRMKRRNPLSKAIQ